ncbi:MAG: hypothetical protein KGM47_13820, partial [Acidobacteriota bacterium]|nr:hypothetical protein [Acidobacteriota bacterium]
LDAEPTSGVPTELRPWDRVLLLQLLSSVLRDTRWSSVRLIAFNLAQERQIFTDDAFNESGFVPLSRALTNLDLTTIPYQAIEPGAMEHFLVRLTDGSSKGAVKPLDAVVIIGPVARLNPVNPQVLPRPAGDQKAPLFYFQYFSHGLSRQHIPDAIADVTTAWGGTVFNIDSPAGLAKAISKFEAVLNPNKS